jgi:hypothetical protein
VGAVVLWLIGGVGAADLVRYLAYEAGFVVLPGWLVLHAVAPGIRSRPWQLALGWPIGLTLEILAFILTAALGARDLFLAYPVVVGVPAALVIWQRRRASPPTEPAPPLFSAGARWAMAGLCLLAFAYIGVAYFTLTPLPGTAPGVVYPPDMIFNVVANATALHSWPLTDYRVAGQPFDYHYYVNLHMAAVSQVTGIHPSLVLFRLYLLPLTALLVLQLGLAGRLIGDRSWAGVLTVALFLLVRELDLSVSDLFPFDSIGIWYLWGSPSHLLGAAIFVPALVLLSILLDPRVAARASPYLGVDGRALWITLALLLIGAGGAKSVILPMLVAGIGVYLVGRWMLERRLDRTAAIALGLCTALWAIYYALLYQGNSLGLGPHPPATLTQMPPLERMHDAWPGGALADVGYWLLAAPIGTLGYFAAPLLGLILWLTLRGRAPLGPMPLLCVSLLLVGAAGFFVVRDEFREQTYMSTYGLIAIMPLAATGFLRYGDTQLRSPAVGWRKLGIFAAIWVTAVVVLELRADRLWASQHYLRADLATYGPVALAIGALILGALILKGRARQLLAALAVMAVMLSAILDTPLDLIPYTVRNLQNGTPLHQASPAGLRTRELRGMEWIRDNVPKDAVLAVSNDRTAHTSDLGPLDGDYPAFTEDRTFREAWAYTTRANEIGQIDTIAGRKDPFPARTRLERALYERGNRDALRTMVERYGVTHIVVSKKDGAVNPRLYRLGSLIYSNDAIDVIDVSHPGLTR